MRPHSTEEDVEGLRTLRGFCVPMDAEMADS